MKCCLVTALSLTPALLGKKGLISNGEGHAEGGLEGQDPGHLGTGVTEDKQGGAGGGRGLVLGRVQLCGKQVR